MHIYLVKEGKPRKLIVYLLDGYSPRVAGLSGPNTDRVTSGLEPGIWFKILVADRVWINCMTRMVFWTACKDGLKGKSVLDSDDLSSNWVHQLTYDCDDNVDELFELAEYALEAHPTIETDEELRAKHIECYEQKLFKLLHLHILPKIKLEPKDREKLAAAMHSQMAAIQQMEQEVLVHTQLLEIYEKRKKQSLQVDILPMLEKYYRNGRADKNLMDTVKLDIATLLPSVQAEMEEVAHNVQDLRYRCQLESKIETSSEIIEATQKKNSLAVTIHDYLIGREFIENLEKAGRIAFPESVTLLPVAEFYLTFKKKIQFQIEKIEDLVRKKILAVSVREMMHVAEEDLQIGQSSVGEEITIFGKRTTDVDMESDKGEEWQTLDNRVASIVHNLDLPISQVYHNFTRLLIQKCKALCTTAELLKQNPTTTLREYSEYFAVEGNVVKVDQALLEDLKLEIHLHLQAVSDLLVEGLGSHPSDVIRLSYDKCFFHNVGTDLMELYRLAYATSIESLDCRLRRIREYPIYKLGLGLKDEWWLSLLDRDNSKTEEENLNDSEVKCLCHNIKISKEKVLQNCPTRLSDRFAEDDSHTETKKMTKTVKSTHQTGPENDYSEDVFCDANENGNQLVSDKTTHVVRKNSLIITGLEEKTWNKKPCNRLSCRRWSHKDKFRLHFQPTIDCVKRIFNSDSPLTKMQYLTSALQLLSQKVKELRMKTDEMDDNESELSADDLLPLIVLMLLKFDPSEVSTLFVELIYIFDLMPDFLRSGQHCYSLTTFQVAFCVLEQTCGESK